MPDVGGVSGDRLRSFVERIERLNDQVASLKEDTKEVYSESKSNGFDTKILRQVIKLRSMDKDDRDEADTLVNLYLRALGE